MLTYADVCNVGVGHSSSSVDLVGGGDSDPFHVPEPFKVLESMLTSYDDDDDEEMCTICFDGTQFACFTDVCVRMLRYALAYADVC